jgi:hypothetical protein
MEKNIITKAITQVLPDFLIKNTQTPEALIKDYLHHQAFMDAVSIRAEGIAGKKLDIVLLDESSLYMPDVLAKEDDKEYIKTPTGGIWDKEALIKYGQPSIERMNEIELLKIHNWLFFEGKHYDATCPEGVDSWYKLPTYKGIFR